MERKAQIINILYLGDPRLIHDIKWISFFSEKETFNCFLIARKCHIKDDRATKAELATKKITFLGTIEDCSIVRPFKSFRESQKISKFIKAYKIDLFHLLYAEPNALWGLFKKTFKTPILLTSRGTDILKTIPDFSMRKDVLGRLVWRTYIKAFSQFDFVASTSVRQQNNIIQLLHVSPQKTEVIRTGVDVAIPEKLQHPFGNQKFILFPRAMRPLYDHELALEAIAEMDSHIATDYNYVFLGKDSSDTDYIHKIKTHIKRHIYSDKLLFLDSVGQNEIFNLYHHASLVMMTPKSDGSPVSAVESMLTKTPLVLPNLEYDQTLFGNVLCYKKGNQKDAALKMKEALNSDGVREGVNFDAALQHADRQKEMKKLEKRYFTLI